MNVACTNYIMVYCTFYISVRLQSTFLAVMISPDDRKRKHYALPVQFIPYVSLTQMQIRSIVTRVAKAMKTEGMNVVGKA